MTFIFTHTSWHTWFPTIALRLSTVISYGFTNRAIHISLGFPEGKKGAVPPDLDATNENAKSAPAPAPAPAPKRCISKFPFLATPTFQYVNGQDADAPTDAVPVEVGSTG